MAEQDMGKYQKESSDWSISRDQMITLETYIKIAQVFKKVNQTN